LFLRAIGKVNTLPSKTTKRPQVRDEPLKDDLSDDIDLTHLLTYDPDVSFRREDVGEDVIRKLRRGVWRIQGELDLHNLRSDEARATLAQYIRQAAAEGWRCIRIVHGKGLGSAGNAPILKTKVLSWLVQLNEVRAFVQANVAEGGAGALVVLIGGIS
jgi:DNA-nicking Smr family endonuclease